MEITLQAKFPTHYFSKQIFIMDYYRTGSIVQYIFPLAKGGWFYIWSIELI